jgi:four helix bundle protein
MQDFRQLKVWEKAHELTLRCYRATSNFPSSELYGLRSQIRRTSVSIPSNIAEGCGRGSDADFARMLQIAQGSTYELEYQLLLSKDLEFLPANIHAALHDQTIEVKKMLSSLLQRVRGTAEGS